jgi:hypothetical protein
LHVEVDCRRLEKQRVNTGSGTRNRRMSLQFPGDREQGGIGRRDRQACQQAPGERGGPE